MHRMIFNLLIISFLCFNSLFSQVPKLINYQGFINSAGEPLNGSYEIKFSLLDQPTEGTYLWTETQTVSINEGKFNVLLGSVNELDESLFLNNGLFLEIKIGSETLDPRVQLTSVAYSLLSKSVEVGSVGTDQLIDGAITQDKLSEDLVFTPTGEAGGDLGGAYPNPTVENIQGKSVSTNEPSTGQVLKWDGTQWKPDYDITGDTNSININVSDRLVGTGSESNPLDIAQQGAGVGQVLKWDGNVWKPSDDISEIGTAGGDITAVYAGQGLTDGGVSGDVTINVGAGNGIKVNEDNIELEKTYTDDQYVNENQASSITSSMIKDGEIQNTDIAANAINSSKIENNSISVDDISPNIISSIEGVSVDGGNINLVEGDNITISSNNTNKTITINATGTSTGSWDHKATQNISLNGNYLSGDGGDEGIYVNGSGKIGINANNLGLQYNLELGNKDELNNYMRIHSKDWGGLLFANGTTSYSGGISYGHATNSIFFDTKTPASGVTNTKVVIKGAGNVGIGTTNPMSRLHIVDSDDGSGEIFNNSNGLIVENSGSSNDYFVLQTATAGGGKSFVITNAGNVGIATDNPSAKLHLSGGSFLLGSISNWSSLANASIYADGSINSIGDINAGNDLIASQLRLGSDARGNGNIKLYNDLYNLTVEIGQSSSKSGQIYLEGLNGTPNILLSHSSLNPDRGLLELYDDSGIAQAGILVNESGQGIVWGDSKQFRIDNPNQPGTEICYTSIEGPEAAAFIRGSGNLIDGKAIVELPEHFSVVTNNDNITINVTALDASSKGLAVIEKSNKKFIVVELFEGKGNYDFDFTVFGTRVGYENYNVIQEKLSVSKK